MEIYFEKKDLKRIHIDNVNNSHWILIQQNNLFFTIIQDSSVHVGEAFRILDLQTLRINRDWVGFWTQQEACIKFRERFENLNNFAFYAFDSEKKFFDKLAELIKER